MISELAILQDFTPLEKSSRDSYSSGRVSIIEREITRIRKIGWRGVLAGFLLSVLVAPLIAPYITPIYASVGAVSSPNLSASVELVDSPYSAGDRAGKYGNITWEEGYDVYRVQFQHSGGPPIDRAVFEVRFPGCVEQASGFGSGNGAVTASSPLKAEVYTSNRTGAEVVQCTVQISTQSIYENEGYTLEFVVDHTPERCNLLTAYNPSQEYFIDYDWTARGTQLDGRLVGEIRGAEAQFQDIRLPPDSTKLVEKEDYKAFIYGVGDGNESQAMNKCFR